MAVRVGVHYVPRICVCLGSAMGTLFGKRLCCTLAVFRGQTQRSGEIRPDIDIPIGRRTLTAVKG